MTGVVVDASVAIKWVVDEEDSANAVRLMDGPTLSAPDLLMSECANILWKKARRGDLTRNEAVLAIERGNVFATAGRRFVRFIAVQNAPKLQDSVMELHNFSKPPI